MRLSFKAFELAVDKFKGYCTKCDKLTRNNTEGDAENYDCPKCKQNTVMGTEQALMYDLIEVI